MTHKEHAEKVWDALQEKAVAPWFGNARNKRDEIAVIAAALERQREADAKLVEGWHYKKGGYTELAYRIRQNEVGE